MKNQELNQFSEARSAMLSAEKNLSDWEDDHQNTLKQARYLVSKLEKQSKALEDKLYETAEQLFYSCVKLCPLCDCCNPTKGEVPYCLLDESNGEFDRSKVDNINGLVEIINQEGDK